MSKINLHSGGGIYGAYYTGDADVRGLVDLVLKPILAQHIVDDGRLKATLKHVEATLDVYINETALRDKNMERINND